MQLLSLSLSLALSLAAASCRASMLTAQDLVGLHKLASPVASPNGQTAAFTVSRYNTSSAITTRTLYISHLPSKQAPVTRTPTVDADPISLGVDVGSDPFWVSDTLLGVLCQREGLTQICIANLDSSHDGSPLEFKQITHTTLGVSTAKFHRASNLLAFTANIEVSQNLRKGKGASGVVFDQLFVRHWDTYVNPTIRSHLFVVRLQIDSATHTARISETDILDLFSNSPNLETPVAPFGSAADYNFSPDGSLLVFASRVPERKAAWNTNTDIYTVLTDGTQPPVSISKSNLGYDALPVFSPSGKYIAWLQMQTPGYESDKNSVVMYNRENSKLRVLTKKWDRSAESISFQSETLMLVIAQDMGHHKIFRLDVTTERIVSHYSASTIHSIDYVPGTTTFLALSNSMTTPDELVLVNMDNWTASPLTSFNAPLLSDITMSVPQEFWFKGAHNEKVHGWVLKPYGYDKTKTYPLAFLIHGGPEGAWNDDWSYRWNPQVFAAQGYFVATVNFHGSTGFGVEFTRSILGNWGGAPFEDLMKGLQAVLKANPEIDPRRVAGLGASYGGYMINWINGHSKKFSCLVNHDGIFDTRSAYFSTEELFFAESEFKGTPFNRKAAKIYEKWSPSLYSHRWETPTLVIHGERDYRLSITEGLSTFTALQRRGVPSRLLYFPDENHWVLKPANSLQWHAEIFDWIGTYTSESAVASHEIIDINQPDVVVFDDEVAPQLWAVQDTSAESEILLTPTRLSTVHGRRHSSIDHFVCNAPARALLTSPRVDRQTAVTDHFVIRTSIRAEAQGQPPAPRAPTISRHHCLEATDRIATSNYWDVLADGAADNTDTDTDIHQLTSQFLESANAVADNLSLRLSPPATRSNRRLLSGATKRAILASNTARQAFIAAATNPNPDLVQCNTLRDEWYRLKAAATQLERADGRKQWVKHADNLDRAVSDGRTDLVFSAARAMSGNSSRSVAVTPLYNSDGIVQYDPISILRVMQGHYGSLAADTTGHSLDLQYWHDRQPIQASRDTPPIRNSDILDQDFSWNQIAAALLQMSPTESTW
ncbi:hypothetical protein BASA81_015009 [Batrachochytrium salamandrivorans]|nr:hypothetical protein BASA81_015009 [Batrachochytrium salamandrivorans]